MVDDLLAITIIAIFYTDDLAVTPLLLALVPLALFTLLVQRRVRRWWLLLPLALLTWVLVHESGVHATVAGVLLGFAVPVVRRRRGTRSRSRPSTSSTAGARCRPAWPSRSSRSSPRASAWWGGGAASALTSRVTLGIVVGLVVGKTIGVLGATWLVQRFTRARLADDLSWWDVLGLSLLAGIGFTVSLLIGELAFGTGTPQDDMVKIGVLAGSLISALLATVVLRARSRVYRRICAEERVDADADGVPDVYQRDTGNA